MLEVRDTMLLHQRKTYSNSVMGPDSSSGHQGGQSLAPASTVTVEKGWPSHKWAFPLGVHWDWTENPREPN